MDHDAALGVDDEGRGRNHVEYGGEHRVTKGRIE
jgi:hypothetical protein